MSDYRPTRRDILRLLAWGGLGAAAGAWLLARPEAARLLVDAAGPLDAAAAEGGNLVELLKTAPEARWWVGVPEAGGVADCLACHDAGVPADPGGYVHEEGLVRCLLCAQRCLLAEGERGRCRARLNLGGRLVSLVYGRPLSLHLDPIEKKPFYHFLPGATAYSLATAGCPLRCRFCQNWQISQADPEDYDVPYVPPARIAADAAGREAPVIAFTYNEPTVFAEYMVDIARLARQEGLRCVMVSCGITAESPLGELCGALDAIKIDLKGFDPGFYRRVCGAELAPVLRSIRQVAASGTHLELVNLVVPTLNDSDAALRGLAEWVAGEVGPDVPVHFTRFHPDHQLRNLPPTPVATLERARAIAMDAGLRYAFVGNVPGHAGNHTYCPACGKIVIERQGFFVTARHLDAGRCACCGAPITGVWN
ncbi:MAG: AmmeMemoRadiSam system radical SAM enzyme [Candidatus Krumholzibacteriota bacterium]|nr:AmmeMemoRadiSam system radical SAM enzyme [Candidatus Krumholzibacteriota bacterium]